MLVKIEVDKNQIIEQTSSYVILKVDEDNNYAFSFSITQGEDTNLFNDNKNYKTKDIFVNEDGTPCYLVPI